MHDKTKKKTKILLAVFFALVSCPLADAASPRRAVKEGNRRYEMGDYGASREKYTEALKRDPESDIINFNLGTALYKEEDYEKAVDHLQKALLSEDETLKKNAYYNLGNALYRLGMTRAEDDRETAISYLKRSRSQYEQVLSMDEAEQDAKHNYEYVQEKLKRLKEQMEQQKSQQPSDPDQSGELQSEDQQEKQVFQRGDEIQRQEDGGEEPSQQQGQEQQGDRGETDQEQNEQGESEDQQGAQEKSDQERGQGGAESYNKQQETSGSAQDGKELTEREAQMLLESYQQAEEPRGLLQLYQRKSDPQPVLKDW